MAASGYCGPAASCPLLPFVCRHRGHGGDEERPTRFAAIYGGVDLGNRHLDDLHLLHMHSSEWAWVQVKQSSVDSILPSPRASPLVACVPNTSELIVFGGSSGWSEHGDTHFHGDTYTLDLSALLERIEEAVDAPADASPEAEEEEAEEEEEAPLSKKAKLIETTSFGGSAVATEEGEEAMTKPLFDFSAKVVEPAPTSHTGVRTEKVVGSRGSGRVEERAVVVCGRGAGYLHIFESQRDQYNTTYCFAACIILSASICVPLSLFSARHAFGPLQSKRSRADSPCAW